MVLWVLTLLYRNDKFELNQLQRFSNNKFDSTTRLDVDIGSRIRKESCPTIKNVVQSVVLVFK